MELESSEGLKIGDHTTMATQTSNGMEGGLAEGNESFSKSQTDNSPLLAREETEGSSYEGEYSAQTLAEMEQTLMQMEQKYAAYVRHDRYGTMGKGDIPVWEKAVLVLSLLVFVPIKVVLLFTIVIAYYIVCRVCTMFRAPDHNGIEEMNGVSSISSAEAEGEKNGVSRISSAEAEGEKNSVEEENGSDAGKLSHGGQENYAHLTGLRRVIIVHLGRFFSRAILFVLGFYWIKVIRRDKKPEAALLQEGMILVKTDLRPGAIVSNHVSYIDILYHMSASFPSFVAKRSVARLPLIGLISKCLGCVYVQREDKPSDFKGVAGIIKKRLQAAASDKNAPLMLLFPEGTTTNGYYLLPFKTGAFLAGMPVQPVILKYPYRRFSPAWDTISGVRHAVLLLCQFINFLEVIWLPVYIPSEKEKSDPKLYASNVRKLMALEGGLLLADIGLKEKRIYHSFLKEYLALKGSA